MQFTPIYSNKAKKVQWCHAIEREREMEKFARDKCNPFGSSALGSCSQRPSHTFSSLGCPQPSLSLSMTHHTTLFYFIFLKYLFFNPVYIPHPCNISPCTSQFTPSAPTPLFLSLFLKTSLSHLACLSKNGRARLRNKT